MAIALVCFKDCRRPGATLLLRGPTPCTGIQRFATRSTFAPWKELFTKSRSPKSLLQGGAGTSCPPCRHSADTSAPWFPPPEIAHRYTPALACRAARLATDRGLCSNWRNLRTQRSSQSLVVLPLAVNALALGSQVVQVQCLAEQDPRIERAREPKRARSSARSIPRMFRDMLVSGNC